MTKKIIRNVLKFLLLAILLVSIGMTVRQQLLYRSIVSESAEAAQIAGLSGQQSSAKPAPDRSEHFEALESALPLDEDAPSEENELDMLASIDLAALRAVNQDVVGWIAIPGTELSYPLMQRKDNQFYLSHNWKGEASGGGSVFLDSNSSRDLTGFHTIVFAHRMQNDTMFGVLKYYKDADFWQEHPHIYLVIDDGVYRYDIFSAQEASVKGVVYRLDIQESGLEEEFIRYCVENSVIDTGITPDADGRFLTLSTCTENGYANRWVVHGCLAEVYSIKTQG